MDTTELTGVLSIASSNSTGYHGCILAVCYACVTLTIDLRVVTQGSRDLFGRCTRYTCLD